MKSTISFAGTTHDFSVKHNELNVPTPAEIGIGGAEKRWIGSRVRLKPEVLELMKETRPLGAFGLLENPHAIAGVLPLALLSNSPPAPTDEYIITSVRRANVGTLYKVALNTPVEERRAPVRVLEVSRATSEGVPGVYDEHNKQENSVWVLPPDTVEIVSFASTVENYPEPGIDYVAPEWVAVQHQYLKVDQSCEGFTNRPTALLAKAISQDAAAVEAMEALRDSRGRIEGRKLCQLSFEKCWEGLFLKAEDYLTPGFPCQYRLLVNYTQLAEHFIKVCVS